jgi:Uma2 family endonuclease
MAGTSFRHSLIKDNVSGETRNQLRNGPCRVVTSDQRVKVKNTGLYTYPDIVIVCDEPQFEDKMFDTLLNPRVLVEVLSDSTEKYDRGTKFDHYRQLTSLQEYVLISQDRALVERFIRQPDNSWPVTVFDEFSQIFVFASIPVQIPLEEIYRGVQFSESRPGPPESSPNGEPG